MLETVNLLLPIPRIFCVLSGTPHLLATSKADGQCNQNIPPRGDFNSGMDERAVFNGNTGWLCSWALVLASTLGTIP